MLVLQETVLLATAALCLLAPVTHAQSKAERRQRARAALEYVDRIASDPGNCAGTGNTLNLVFNTSVWAPFTATAIRTATFLSKRLMSNNNTLDDLDLMMFYDLVRNNVHGNTLIFGSAVGFQPGVYSAYPHAFCPYASKQPDGSIKAFDLGPVYDYFTNNTEWYYELMKKDFSNVTREKDVVTAGGTTTTYVQPVPSLQDGRWTYPYYDCGAGNIWMVTYSSPMLSVDANNDTIFMGVATIDIELTRIDINQCDDDNDFDDGALDVFRSTHSCRNATTTCVPLAGQGFVRGAYLCECKPGYYFPNTSAEVKAFSGFEMELFFDLYNSTSDSVFQCTPCARACDQCVDATPCLYDVSLPIRISVVVLTLVMILAIAALSLAVFHCRTEMAIKTASPIFLQLMCLGAVIICCQVFVFYGEATKVTCIVAIWPLHLGFFVLYGALLSKTWRISVIFRPGTVKRVNLPDKALLQRFIPLLVAVVVFLTLWSIFDPPQVQMLVAANERKFFNCSLTIASYVAYGCEALMLLFGVYLCFTVRKAPAYFNESKHITWSTYNAIILGSFVLILTQSIALSAGPDIIYLLVFAQLQIFITITFVLIFVPKFWALYKGTQLQEEEERDNTVTKTITGRVKKVLPGNRSNARDVASQTDSPSQPSSFPQPPPSAAQPPQSSPKSPPSQPIPSSEATPSTEIPPQSNEPLPTSPHEVHPESESPKSSEPQPSTQPSSSPQPPSSSLTPALKDNGDDASPEFIKKVSTTSKYSAKVSPMV